MIKKSIIVKLNKDLDARPIALLVQEASQYDSQIYIEVENKRINAKSIMGMMSLQLAGGDALTVVADGNDEEVAVNGIEQFLTDKK